MKWGLFNKIISANKALTPYKPLLTLGSKPP